ncbi:glycosyltransferase family 29 protein [Celeribacter sp.]|uniref:glycosyltransferase family 29 protein n=1 Tax=Celeribacter sp. TaxID=1890673 RepID=UPI003A8CEDBC
MGKFGFFIARLLRREAPLARLSVPQAKILKALEDKTVAIVGNARALSKTAYGAEIDTHDVVIRINGAPVPAAISHGTKTDWLAMATRVPAQELSRINAARLMWFSHKRKRLDWHVAQTEGFYLHPLSDYAKLERTLGRQPTTGAMVIDLVSRSNAVEINLYGFDFFSSLSLSGRRSAEDVPHDFDAEAAFVKALIRADPRVSLHEMK